MAITEYWPEITAAIAGTWLLLSIFVFWRRAATNLTPVHAATVNPKAEPDFLTVDKKARKAALQRGAEADARIAARNHVDNTPAVQPAIQRSWSWLGTVAVGLSVLTLAAVVVAIVYPEGSIADYIATGGLDSLKESPICIALSVLVLLTRIAVPFINRRTAPAA